MIAVMRRASRQFASVLLLTVALTGCISGGYVDNDGATHLWAVGFVRQVHPPKVPPADVAATGIRFEIIGLGALSSAAGTSVSLGYSRETVLSLANDAYVAKASLRELYGD
jgi:hypothetical protein